VNDPKTDNLIRWSEHGRSFLVIDEDEFSKTLIPDLFKHNNYASFVRQLNMYGFHKVVGLADGSLKTSEQRSKPPSEYENPYFKRGLPDLMWLIQKPKSKSTRSKGKKGIKQEDPDTDKEDLSDTEAGRDDMGGGYLEGPKDGHEGGRNRGIDLNAVTAQLDAVRNHQAMISQAINRLRKDHQQLYEQSLAFQSLHDRHENSINAILTFLATVYDKSLGGHITGAVQNLFNNHGDQARAGASAAAPNGAIVPAQNGRPMRTPQMLRRTPLLLEGGTPYFEPITELSPGGTDSANPGSPGNAENRNQGNGTEGMQSQTPQNPPTRNLFELFNNQPAHSPPEHGFFSLPTSPTTISNSGSPTIGSASVPPPAIGIPQQSQPQPPQQPSTILPNGHALTPRSIAKSLGSTFNASTSRALQDHNASMAHKAQEIEELEILQKRQSEHIESLVGMMRGSFEGSGQDTDIENRDVPSADEFFNFGDGLEYAGLSGSLDDSLNEALGGGLGAMGSGLNGGLDLGTAGLGGSALNSDVLGEEEIESLLKGVGVADNTTDSDELVPPIGLQTQAALSPGASSAGSRAREEEQLDSEGNGETASKRRRVQ
jgi:heat shock transcription factor